MRCIKGSRKAILLGHGEPEVNSQSVVLEQCSLLTCYEEFLHVRDNPFEDFYCC